MGYSPWGHKVRQDLAIKPPNHKILLVSINSPQASSLIVYTEYVNKCLLIEKYEINKYFLIKEKHEIYLALIIPVPGHQGDANG